MTRGRGGWLHLSPYGSFIRYSMSVYPDAFGPSHFSDPNPAPRPKTQNLAPRTHQFPRANPMSFSSMIVYMAFCRAVTANS